MKKILKIKALCLLVAVITLVSNVSAVFVGAFNLVIVTGNTHSTTGEGSFLYVMLSDGTCAVTGYVGCEESVTVPQTIYGIPVTAIVRVQDSRYYCSDITIGPNVKQVIGETAWAAYSINYKSLKIIADGLVIEEYGFAGFKYLEKLEIEGKIESIGQYAFASCKKLREVRLPEGITVIPEGMFYGCSSLEKIVLPSTVKKIDDMAFFGCSSLKSVTVPEGVTDIAGDAFKETPVESTIKPIASDGLIYDDWRLVAADFSKINGTVVIKNGTMAIYPGVFKDCTTLTEIILPKDFSSIGAEAFANCTNLKKVSGGAGHIGESAFENCTNLKTFTGAMGNPAKRAFACSGITEASVGGNVGDEAFKDCTSLTKVNIKEGNFGREVFAGTSIEYVYIPGTIRDVPEGLFVGCNTIKEILIGHGVTSISARAFDCNGYTEIILPETLNSIGLNAITSEDLTDVYYATSAQKFGWLTVREGNEALTNATLHCDKKNIFYQYWDMPLLGEWAFGGFKYCLLNGLMNGTAEHYISPNVITTRAQLVTLLWRLEGSPDVEGDAKFTDITADWYADAVAWAAENGIVMGTSETTFSPDRDITRQEAATLLFRYSEFKGYNTENRVELSAFTDHGEVMDFAYDALSWANGEGLITGVSDYGKITLQPKGFATRAQIATIIMRYCGKYTTDNEQSSVID
ncbi:MAG: leucine-rich repeat protein [Clostridia bacterium]|nr:leucine-rich repeat protein [Clostridia bacterium]